MSVKRAFFSIFQKLTLFCCAIFFGFANAFSANLPSGYTELEYVTFNATQSLDTGFTPNQNSEIRIKYSTNTIDSWIYGTGSTNPRITLYSSNAGNQRFGNVYVPGTNLYGSKGAIHIDIQNKSGVNHDGTLLSYNGSVGTFTAEKSLTMGVSHGDTGVHKFDGNVYYLQIYDNGVMVRNYVPVKKGSQIGLYDTVNGGFLTDSNLVAGPVVLDSCRNLLNVNDPNRNNNHYLADGNRAVEHANFAISDYIAIPAGTTTLTYSTDREGYGLGQSAYAAFYTANKTYISSVQQGTDLVRVMNVPNNAAYIKVSFSIVEGNWQLEVGSTATAYVPFCENAIKIATTAYNTAQFNPVVTDLNSTIATIRSVVTNTINQTKAIADLQAKKQTRPDEQCPAGKKCLLVETEENGVIVPHWYEIIEKYSRLPEGYTELEYVKFSGGQYVDTGIVLTQTTNIENVISMQSDCGSDFCTWTGFMPSSSVTTPRYGINELSGAYMLGINTTASGLSRDANKHILKFVTSGSNQILYDVVDESNIRTLVSTSLSGSFYGNTLSLYVGARHSSSTPVNFVSGKIYYTYLKQNGNLLYDYIPAKRDSDGAIGFYDNVSQSFKAPSGTLTAGPEI